MPASALHSMSPWTVSARDRADRGRAHRGPRDEQRPAAERLGGDGGGDARRDARGAPAPATAPISGAPSPQRASSGAPGIKIPCATNEREARRDGQHARVDRLGRGLDRALEVGPRDAPVAVGVEPRDERRAVSRVASSWPACWSRARASRASDKPAPPSAARKRRRSSPPSTYSSPSGRSDSGSAGGGSSLFASRHSRRARAAVASGRGGRRAPAKTRRCGRRAADMGDTPPQHNCTRSSDPKF